MRHRRSRSSSTEIAAVLSAYRRSGLSQRAFAARRGLSLSTFCRWLRLDRSKAAAAAFLRVDVPALPAAEFELVLADGRRLRVPPTFDPAVLRTLLEVLAAC